MRRGQLLSFKYYHDDKFIGVDPGPLTLLEFISNEHTCNRICCLNKEHIDFHSIIKSNNASDLPESFEIY